MFYEVGWKIKKKVEHLVMNYFAINKLETILLQLSFCLVLEGAIINTTGDVCLSWNFETCVGGDRGLTSAAVQLSYVSTGRITSGTIRSLQLLKNTTYNVTHSLKISVGDNTNSHTPSVVVAVAFMFTQYEHGGGKCNCVDIYFNNNCKDDHNRLDLFGKGVYFYIHIFIANKWTITFMSNFMIIH